MIGRNRVSTVQGYTALQYHNGKTMCMGDKSSRAIPFAGFSVEVGKSEKLDSVFTALQTPQVQIKHMRKGGFEIKAHWNLGEALEVVPLTVGPTFPTLRELLRAEEAPATQGSVAASGLYVSWPAGDISSFGLLVMVRPMPGTMEVLPELLSFTVKSKTTEHLLAILLAHCAVCMQADTFYGREMNYTDLALPLALGPEEERTSKEKGASTTVSPLVTTHPERVKRAYTDTLLSGLTEEQVDVAFAEGVAWAIGRRQRDQQNAVSGDTGQAEPAAYDATGDYA